MSYSCVIFLFRFFISFLDTIFLFSLSVLILFSYSVLFICSLFSYSVLLICFASLFSFSVLFISSISQCSSSYLITFVVALGSSWSFMVGHLTLVDAQANVSQDQTTISTWKDTWAIKVHAHNYFITSVIKYYLNQYLMYLYMVYTASNYWYWLFVDFILLLCNVIDSGSWY